MKRIYYPLVLLLILCGSMLACKKDTKEPEETKRTQEELIIGKWQLTKGYDLNGQDVADDCDKKISWNFL